MFGGLSRSLGQGVRRAAGNVARQAARTPMAMEATMPQAWMTKPLLRPFSVLGASSMQQLAAPLLKPAMPARPMPPVMAPVPQASKEVLEETTSATPTTGLTDLCKKDSMVFEIGISFVVLHYQSIFIGVMRCLFQAFRPLLILFIFGQIIKAVFFIAGAPIWMSFYSIWMFEVTYGLAQCAISFIFISFFYNNLSFARMRPALSQMLRKQKEKLARAARALL
mmetsp:Transcript_100451/g.139647  ORF Transcript_100451/g.139647 Transcript_100451/m.139647 type:complete len:223 (+) Transcript_100451:68-736(+)